MAQPEPILRDAEGQEWADTTGVFYGVPAEVRPAHPYEDGHAPWWSLWDAFAARDRALAQRAPDAQRARLLLDRADNWARLAASERRQQVPPDDDALALAGKRVARLLRDGEPHRIEDIIDRCWEDWRTPEAAVRWALTALIVAGGLLVYSPGIVRREPGAKLVAPRPREWRAHPEPRPAVGGYTNVTAIGAIPD